MKKLRFRLLIFTSVFMICSCSIVDLKHRKGKDQHLDFKSSQKLLSNYNNTHPDTNYELKSLYENLSNDSIDELKNYTINLKPVNDKIIQLNLIDNNKIIDSLYLKGKYKKGYFKLRTEVKTSFIAGPLLWILAENKKFLGITNENNLVVLDSGGSGMMFLIVIPLFAAGGGSYEIEYEQAK